MVAKRSLPRMSNFWACALTGTARPSRQELARERAAFAMPSELTGAGRACLFRPADPHATLPPYARGGNVGSHKDVNAFPPAVIQTVADLPLALEAVDRDAHSLAQSLGLEVPRYRDDVHARAKTQSEGCERAIAL